MCHATCHVNGFDIVAFVYDLEINKVGCCCITQLVLHQAYTISESSEIAAPACYYGTLMLP
jgi:hypothetical protein